MSQNPYQQPAAPPITPSSQGKFLSPRTPAVLILVGIITFIVADVGMSICVTLNQLIIPFNGNGQLSDTGQAVLFVAYGFLLLRVLGQLFAAVFTCVFMYRTNVNARAMGATGMEHTPGWCGGYWFIPILNLVMPYRCMNEINKASRSPKGTSWKQLASESLIGLWWGLYILGNLTTNIVDRFIDAELIIDPMVISLLSWASSILAIGAAIAFMMVIRRITRLQSGPGRAKATKQSARYGEHLYS